MAVFGPSPKPSLGSSGRSPACVALEEPFGGFRADLEWVQGEWAESADTVDGTHVHRRVDREDRPLPSAEVLADQDRPRTRSVTLSSRRLGLVAKIDMVESDSETVVPVDYKRGKRPHVAAGAYEPERVRICVQGLLLEENGHRCTEGALYFAESRERVRVVFDEELRAATRGAIGGLRLVWNRSGPVPSRACTWATTA